MVTNARHLFCKQLVITLDKKLIGQLGRISIYKSKNVVYNKSESARRRGDYTGKEYADVL